MNIFMLPDAPINLDALVFKSQFVSDWHITFTTDVSILPFFFFSVFLGDFFCLFYCRSMNQHTLNGRQFKF